EAVQQDSGKHMRWTGHPFGAIERGEGPRYSSTVHLMALGAVIVRSLSYHHKIHGFCFGRLSSLLIKHRGIFVVDVPPKAAAVLGQVISTPADECEKEQQQPHRSWSDAVRRLTHFSNDLPVHCQNVRTCSNFYV